MAFDDLDEHEQGELARKWLRENAVSIAVGVLLGIVLIFGWQQWKARQSRQSLEAASQFQALNDAVEAKREDDVGKIAEALRKDYPNSAYAVFAAMYQADLASKKNDLAAATAALEWARQNAAVGGLKALASLRLAQIKLAQNDANGALASLDGIEKGEYGGLGNEIRGDALVKLGRLDDARNAYQSALTNLDPQAPNRNYVQMKLDDLGAPAATPASAPAKEKLGS